MFSKHKLQTEDQPYITDINATTLYGAPIHSHIILWLTVLFVIIFLVWANFAELDEVTRGSGKIIPSSQIQVIQNLEGGILAEILIKEGQLVEKGQLLLKLDAIRFSSSYNEIKLKYYELLAKVARLTAEINKTDITIPEEVQLKAPDIIANARQLLVSRRNELVANKNILNEQIRQKKQDLIEIRSKLNRITISYKL